MNRIQGFICFHLREEESLENNTARELWVLSCIIVELAHLPWWQE